MELGLDGKTIIVVGATGGLGVEVANQFVRENADVILVGRDEKKLGELKSDLLDRYPSSLCYSVVADATETSGVSDICRFLDDNGLVLNGLVTNVGDGRISEDSKSHVDEFYWYWRVNFQSALLPIYALRERLSGNNASITMVSSIAGINVLGAPTGYGVAKAAINVLCKDLSFKLAPEIRVNVVAPGNIMFEGSVWQKKAEVDPAKVKDMLKSKVPLQRFARPEEVASSVLFLSSECASFITGCVLVVDGGQTTSF